MYVVELKIKEMLTIVSSELVKNGLVDYNIKRNKVWTRAIKSSLTKLAYDEFDFEVYTTGNDHDDTTNEYLYDLLWYEPTKENSGDLHKTHLVLESDRRDSRLQYCKIYIHAEYTSLCRERKQYTVCAY